MGRQMLRKQKNCKNWYVVFKRNKKLIWHTTGTPDFDAARQLELEFKASLQKKLLKERITNFIEKMTGERIQEKGMLLKSAFTIYRDEYCKDHAKSSNQKKIIEWQKFLKWLTSKRPDIKYLHEVDYLLIREYQKVLEKETTSGHYFNIRIGNLKSIFTRLKQPAGITDNPFDIVKLKPKEHTSYKAFNETEIETILDNCNENWKTACLIAKNTGLDFTNTKILQWDDFKEIEIDGKKRLIIKTVREKTKRKYGKPLFIPVNNELEQRLNAIKHEGAYVLPDKFRTRNIEGEFPAIIKLAKINSDGFKLGFHCWRHTFNSKLQAEGIASDTRQLLTGHSSAAMNQIYSNSAVPLFKAVDKI